MAHRITLGQYVDADSPIHALNPCVKIVCAFAVMLVVFVIRTPVQLALGFAFMLFVCALSRVSPAKLVRSVLPLMTMLVVLGLTNLLLTTTGDVLAQLGPIRITTDGVRAAFLYSTRLVIGLLAGMMILLTTTPARMTDAFDALLSPLARLGLPAHELAMVFALMLRFIPTLATEALAIRDAQTARGGALDEGSLPHRVRAIASIVVALLASSIDHANDLSRALDARCYEGGAERTHWHPLTLGAADAVAVLATAAFVVATIWLGL